MHQEVVSSTRDEGGSNSRFKNLETHKDSREQEFFGQLMVKLKEQMSHAGEKQDRRVKRQGKMKPWSLLQI